MRLLAVLLASLALLAGPARAQQPQNNVLFVNESNSAVTLLMLDTAVCQLNRAGDATGTACTINIAAGNHTMTVVRADGRAFSATTYGLALARVRVLNDRFMRGDGVRLSAAPTWKLQKLCGSAEAPPAVRRRGCDDVISDPESAPTARAEALVLKSTTEADSVKRIADLGEAIRLDPGSANAFYVRCVTHVQTRDFARAAPDCTEALRLKPKIAEYLRYRGISYLGTANNAAAVADFDASLKLENSATAHYGRGIALTRLGKKSQAKRSLAKGVEAATFFETAFGLKP